MDLDLMHFFFVADFTDSVRGNCIFFVLSGEPRECREPSESCASHAALVIRLILCCRSYGLSSNSTVIPPKVVRCIEGLLYYHQ